MLYLKSDLKFSMYEHRSPRLKARQASVAKETCGSELNRVIYCYPKQVVIYWPFYRWFTVTYLPYSMPTQDVSGHWGKRKIEHKYFHSFLTHSACELGPQDVCYVMPESTPRIGDCGLRIADCGPPAIHRIVWNYYIRFSGVRWKNVDIMQL